MNKILSVVAIAIILAVASWAFFKKPVAAPETETEIPETQNQSDLIPKENDFPAASVCIEPSTNDTVEVTIHEDIPEPRCQQIKSGQLLKINNATEENISLWFGKEKTATYSLPIGESLLITKEIHKILAPGVHVLHGSPYQGSEIWVLEEESSLPPASDEGGPTYCIQVITPAKNIETGELMEFPTPCDVPPGWEPLTSQE